MRIGRIHLERWFRSGSRWIHLLIVGRGVLSRDKYSSSTYPRGRVRIMAAGWSADETRALLGIWGDADVQSKPHESSGPLPLSPLPRAFPSPSTISARLGHEQIEQQEYHERSLASIAFRAREMQWNEHVIVCLSRAHNLR